MKKIQICICFFLCIFFTHGNAQIITTFTGGAGTSYGGDGGPATAALLNSPSGIASDASGNVLFADLDNHRVRKVNASGVIHLVAGNGAGYFSGDGGPATDATLFSPQGVAKDALGNIYIADTWNNVIRKIDTSGIISTFAGTPGFSTFGGDGGPATDAWLKLPYAIVFDASGNLIISDQGNQRIRRVDTGGIISTIAGIGSGAFSGDGGAATAATFNQPAGLAIDAAGNIYVADVINARIRKINTSGIINTVAGDGTLGFGGDGSAATSAELYQPTGVFIDGSGNLLIADMVNQRIRKVNSFGVISTIAGNGSPALSGDGGQATAASLNYPTAITGDGSGNIYISDGMNNRIRKVSPSGIISTYAGSGSTSYGDGGPASAAQFKQVQYVAADKYGNTFIADAYHHKIRKVNAAGIITTVAGNGIAGFNGDGGAATAASFNCPMGIAFDKAGNMYVTDILNNRIRKVDTSGIISTFAGNGSTIFNGDGIAASSAAIRNPNFIAIDFSGIIYIGDQNFRIRKVDTSGIITTIAGNGVPGVSADGTIAAMAKINQPYGLAVDKKNRVYFVDKDKIRTIDTLGALVTITGADTQGYYGDGGAATNATFKVICGISFDNYGNLMIGDEGNDRLRIIDTNGIINTLAGNGTNGHSGDGGAATAAAVGRPTISSMDIYGNVYIVEGIDYIRKIAGPPSHLSINETAPDFKMQYYPNPAFAELCVQSDELLKELQIMDINGTIVIDKKLEANTTKIDIGELPVGVYVIVVNGKHTGKIVKK